MRMQQQNPDETIEQTLRLRPADSLVSASPAFGEAACSEQQYQNQRHQQHAEQNREDCNFKDYRFVIKHD